MSKLSTYGASFGFGVAVGVVFFGAGLAAGFFCFDLFKFPPPA